ncbi:hypothetical protein BC828DRAFT_404471 [Blastocladiella britannica]|nr:hypothetical protein BC828DRAFT_404471 [Blastocladiella britannica]
MTSDEPALGEHLRGFAATLPILSDWKTFFAELHDALQRAPFDMIAAETAALAYGPQFPLLISDLEQLQHLVALVDPHFRAVVLRLDIPPPTPGEELQTTMVYVALPAGYPDVAPCFTCGDVPVIDSAPPPRSPPSDTGAVVSVPWSRVTRFDGAIPHLVAQLQRYHAYWSELELLSASARVRSSYVEAPTKQDNIDGAAKPTPRAVAWRTIDLGNFVSLELPLDPLNVRDGHIPISHAKFTGPSAAVTVLQTKWMVRAAGAWDGSLSLAQNLETVLEIKLVPPQSSRDHSQQSGDDAPGCAICYEGSEDRALEVFCSCGEQFHTECIVGIFRRQGKRQVQVMIFGECPVCNMTLPVKCT